MDTTNITEKGLIRNLSDEVFIEPLDSGIYGILIKENLDFYLLSDKGIYKILDGETINIRYKSIMRNGKNYFRRYNVRLKNILSNGK